MKYIILIVAALMGVSFSLAAPALADDIMQGPLGNSTITTITWEVPITPGRTDTVTGTVEDVIRHLEAVAPEILPEASITSVPGLEPASVPTPFDGALAKRATPSNVLCDELLTYAGREAIKDGYYHLMGLDGSPENGPKSCGRVSCSYRSAIWWCNDNSYSLTLDKWSMIADGVEAVLDLCPYNKPKGGFNGQAFFKGGWNVMVLGSTC